MGSTDMCDKKIETHLNVHPLSRVTLSLRTSSAPGTEQIGLFQQSRIGR